MSIIPFYDILLVVLSVIDSNVEYQAKLKEQAQRDNNVQIATVHVSNSEIECLKKNMFYEARGEGRDGMLAVGHVTINRSLSNRFPDDLCDVVYQTGQFHWVTLEGLRGIPRAEDERLDMLAKLLIEQRLEQGKPDNLTHGATFFHNSSVSPQWHKLEKTASIGDHHFYRY